ncbi:MAG: hypothetical protein M0T85_15950 [Dehalococcoidales bacterium]|nr:hypothetical protein [Dehalococcoidales bacterium]
MQRFDPADIEARYVQAARDYERLAEKVADILAAAFEDAGIKVGPITYRLKDFRSFIEKIVRKRYFDDPFERVEDIAGVRVRCLFPSDTDGVVRIIKSSFDILSFEDLSSSFEEHEFGYQSIHFIVRLPRPEIVKARGRLARLKCEIQVRTLGQDAWSEVNHVLNYKSPASIPPQLRRRLNALSALFEVADREFEAIRAAHSEVLADTCDAVRPGEAINIATLSRFISQRYPWFELNRDDMGWVSVLAGVCEELIRYNVEDIDGLLQVLGDERKVDMQDEAARRAVPATGEPYSEDHFYDPVGRIRVALALTCPEYRDVRPLLID